MRLEHTGLEFFLTKHCSISIQYPCMREQPCMQGLGVSACFSAGVLLLVLQYDPIA
jgi:hypothetical protein